MEVYKTVATVLGVHAHFVIPDPPFKSAKLISVNEHIWGELQPTNNGSEEYVRYTTITAFWTKDPLSEKQAAENVKELNRLLLSMQEATKRFEKLLARSQSLKPPKSFYEATEEIELRITEIQGAFRTLIFSLQDNGFLEGDIEDLVVFEPKRREET